jgi:two-component system LytT family sensor kinase
VTPKELTFSINNSINNYLKDKSGGIGLDNIQKRLKLLYPNRHVMQIRNGGEAFAVEMRIPI